MDHSSAPANHYTVVTAQYRAAVRCRACEQVSVCSALAAAGTDAFLTLEDMSDASVTCVGNDL